MKPELEAKAQDLIDSYRATGNILNDEIKAIIDRWKEVAVQNNIDLVSFKNSVNEEINDVRSAAAKTSAVFNQKLKIVIENAKKILIPNSGNDKPPDYAIRVNNALQFLSLQFDTLTDEKAYEILKGFVDDVEQMRLFKGVIETRAFSISADSDRVEDTYPRTFKKLKQVDEVQSCINRIELIAENLFLYPKLDDERYIMGGTSFMLTMEAYEELAEEVDILRLAKEIDAMAAEMVA